MSSKKRVQQRVLGTLATIENEEQRVCRVLNVRGGNLVDVELADGSDMLCEIPSRFAKKIWMKRGDYLIAELYSETNSNSKPKETKVKAVVVHVLHLDSIKQLKRDGLWPAQFDVQVVEKSKNSGLDPLGLPGNPNRRPTFDSDSEEDRQDVRDDDSDDEDSLGLPPNPNRNMPPDSSSDDE
jgi:probable RNA-binding protein EIF1AD